MGDSVRNDYQCAQSLQKQIKSKFYDYIELSVYSTEINFGGIRSLRILFISDHESDSLESYLNS